MSVELSRKPYPSDVSEEEWAFAAPYLALVREDAPQREHSLREVFNGLRYLVKCGCPCRYLPTNFPPWWVVYQQTQRWIAAHVFESMAEDLRVLRVPPPRFWTAAPYSPHRKVVLVRAMTEPSAAKAANSI